MVFRVAFNPKNQINGVRLTATVNKLYVGLYFINKSEIEVYFKLLIF